MLKAAIVPSVSGAGVPEWPKGAGLGPAGQVLRGFESHPPHQFTSSFHSVFSWIMQRPSSKRRYVYPVIHGEETIGKRLSRGESS